MKTHRKLMLTAGHFLIGEAAKDRSSPNMSEACCRVFFNNADGKLRVHRMVRQISGPPQDIVKKIG